jgi:hypothetical protein
MAQTLLQLLRLGQDLTKFIFGELRYHKPAQFRALVLAQPALGTQPGCFKRYFKEWVEN